MQFLMLNIYLTLVYYAEIKIKTLQTWPCKTFDTAHAFGVDVARTLLN